jgi:hypothetical protein
MTALGLVSFLRDLSAAVGEDTPVFTLPLGVVMAERARAERLQSAMGGDGPGVPPLGVASSFPLAAPSPMLPAVPTAVDAERRRDSFALRQMVLRVRSGDDVA